MIEKSTIDHITRKAAQITNTERVAQYLEAQPQILDQRVEQYAALINMFNDALKNQDPFLLLSPHALDLRQKLVHASIGSLPNILTMEHNPRWVQHFVRGIQQAIPMMLRGQEQRLKIAEYPNEARIDTPSNPQLSEDLLVVGALAHFIEQTYFSWMRTNHIEVAKDDLLAALDEVALRTTLQGEVSPLVDPFTKLGWIKPDRIPTLEENSKLLANAVQLRQKDHVYVENAYASDIVEARSSADIPPFKYGLEEFSELRSLGMFIRGRGLFHVVRKELWEKKSGYGSRPMYMVEILATTSRGGSFSLNGWMYENTHPDHTTDVLYFYLAENSETEFRILRPVTWGWQDYYDKQLEALGTSAQEIEGVVNYAARHNQERQFLLK